MSADQLASILSDMIESSIDDYMQGFDFSNCYEFNSAVEGAVECQIDRMDLPDTDSIMESCIDLMKDPYYFIEAMRKTAEFLDHRIELIRISADQSRDRNRLQSEVDRLKKELDSRMKHSFASDA